MIKEVLENMIKEELSGEETVKSAVDSNTTNNHPLIGKYVVVRARNAGVHYGLLTGYGEFVYLTTARRIWSWTGAFTLSELSQTGVESGRLAVVVPHLTIPINDVGEVMSLTDQAKISLDGNSE